MRFTDDHCQMAKLHFTRSVVIKWTVFEASSYHLMQPLYM